MPFTALKQNERNRHRKMYLLNFVGYCDLASFKKVHPENKKLWPENTGQPKSARAFCCLGLWKMKISHFP